jgi:cytoskeletal protein RodZ
MLALFLGKYKGYVFAITGILIAILWLSVFISNEKQEAVNEFKQQVNEATKQQVIKDEGKVIDAYQPNDAIDSYVDRVYSIPAEASSSDRLQRVETSARATDGNKARVSVGGEDELSDQEINFVREYSEYLQ